VLQVAPHSERNQPRHLPRLTCCSCGGPGWIRTSDLTVISRAL